METYGFLTEDLVKLALEKDKGEDVKLLSFEPKPLSSETNNYIGVVFCVLVKYIKDGSEYEESYVAKLNPPRPVNSFTDVFEEMFGRETDIFSTIIEEGMNVQLAQLKLPPIKTPKLYARSLEKRKEIFIDENLKTQGFKIFDITKGMDMNHSLLVLKELGRFHASSLLYEETLYPKTIPEAFQYFKDPMFDINHGAYKILDGMITLHVEGIYNFLKNSDLKYKKFVKWLQIHCHKITKYYIDGFSPSQQCNVLVHGDCHANNILFKYDEHNIPMDIRLIDLQLSRRASPTSDLNYFFYTSLNGDFRLKNMDRMLKIYYDSFFEVFKRAGKSPPFSFNELTREVESTKIFGLSCSLFALPIMMVSHVQILSVDDSKEEDQENASSKQSKMVEELMKKGGPLQDRLLSIFEELIDAKLFD